MHVETPAMQEDTDLQNVAIPMEQWKTFMKAFSYSKNEDQDLADAYNLMVSSASVFDDDITIIPIGQYNVISMFDDLIGFFEQVKVSDFETIGVNLYGVVDAIDMMYEIVTILDDDENYVTDPENNNISYLRHDIVEDRDFDDFDDIEEVDLYFSSVSDRY